MKFSVGDRIAVYLLLSEKHQARSTGVIIALTTEGYIRFKDDASNCEPLTHPKQCRKLIKKKKEKTPTEKLQALYDSEINFLIKSFWDDGFEWRLGDVFSGLHGDYANRKDKTIERTINDLWDFASMRFPDAKCFKEEK